MVAKIVALSHFFSVVVDLSIIAIYKLCRFFPFSNLFFYLLLLSDLFLFYHMCSFQYCKKKHIIGRFFLTIFILVLPNIGIAMNLDGLVFLLLFTFWSLFTIICNICNFSSINLYRIIKLIDWYRKEAMTLIL